MRSTRRQTAPRASPPLALSPQSALPIMQRIFTDKTGGWVLNRLGIWHNFYHFGEAFHVMQILGMQTHGYRLNSARMRL